MNEHETERCLSFLSVNVEVTFPESERNWRGRDTGKAKFDGMFMRMPSFTGSFNVTDVNETATESIITATCRFVCQTSSSDSQRVMKYTIDNNSQQIVKIEHL